jgi:hypothetical protein
MDRPHYRMWKTVVGEENMTPKQLADQIFKANAEAVKEWRELQNIVLNVHGYTGGLWIGGTNRTPGIMYSEEHTALFSILKPLNIGPIWILSCGAAKDDKGKNFCKAFAKAAGTRVLASDATQMVTASQRLKLALTWDANNIDEFEGTLYAFNAVGTMRVVDDPSSDPGLMTVRE